MIYIIILIIILVIFYYYIFLIKLKIEKLEKVIRKLFNERTNLVPSIYEITTDKINKHDEIFKEILKLRKVEFYEINEEEIKKVLHTESLIHHELNFIFKVCEKNNKLEKNGKFLYIKELLADKNLNIKEKIDLYKEISKIYNKFIFYKKLTIIGLLIPLKKM